MGPEGAKLACLIFLTYYCCPAMLVFWTCIERKFIM